MTPPNLGAQAAPATAAIGAARACGLGTAGAALMFAAIAVLAPLDGSTRAFAWLGFGAAVLSGCLGVIVQARLATVPSSHPGAAQRYLLGLFANLALQAAIALGGSLAAVLLGAERAAIAAFAPVFAACVTVLHSIAVIVIARALHERARAAAAGDSALLPSRSPR